MFIDYRIINDALEYYQSIGYKYIDVPWVVPLNSLDVTAPKGVEKFKVKEKYLVASGEQSFIELIQNKELETNKKYVCVTPCFRDEKEYDELHHLYFMKVELIHVGVNDSNCLEKIINDVAVFFSRYCDIDLCKTDDGIDILYKGIELGSYGIRSHETTGPWIYGTGVAEPRLSQALSYKKIGYSERHIPKGELGELSKIYEEFEELKDAIEQDANIMALVELSDLYGAIESYAEKKFKVSMKDIKKMSDITKRAFKNGRR